MRPPFAKPRRSKGSTDLSALWYLVLIWSTCPNKSMASMSKYSSTLSSSQKSRGSSPSNNILSALTVNRKKSPIGLPSTTHVCLSSVCIHFAILVSNARWELGFQFSIPLIPHIETINMGAVPTKRRWWGLFLGSHQAPWCRSEA